MKETVVLVDYENVKDVNLSALPEDSRVYIFVGKSQQSIPFDLTQSAQYFGERLKWIKIAGDGKNNLDFHLAYYLGRIAAVSKNIDLVVLSKDKGFDALIEHIKKLKISCRRLETLAGFKASKPEPDLDTPGERFARVHDLLQKIDKKARPRKRTTLTHHIASYFKDKKLPEAELDQMVRSFLEKRLITEEKGILSYQF